MNPQDPSLETFRRLDVSRQLHSYGQPILDLRSGDKEPLAIEILTRYEDGGESFRSIAELLHQKEFQGQGRVMLSLHCLETAFRALSAWDTAKEPIPPYVFLNLDPGLLASQLFWDALPSWLKDLPVHAARLVFEITENHLADLEEMKILVTRLREFGVKIAVDDLGQGASSLTALARLEPHFLKLDRSLIANALPAHPDSRVRTALLKALSTFAREAGIGLISEGIETPEEVAVAALCDINYVQGYFFAEPRPLALKASAPAAQGPAEG